MQQLKLFCTKTIKVNLLIAVLTVVSVFAASAQYAEDGGALYYGALYYKAGNVYTSDGGVKLTKANALNYFSSLDDYENYWLKGKRLFTAGIVVSSIGAGLALGGYLFDVINIRVSDFDPFKEMYIPIPSFAGWILGGAMIVASVPLYWVGTVKLKKAAAAGSTGSVAYTPELSFVTQSGGIGLALNF